MTKPLRKKWCFHYFGATKFFLLDIVKLTSDLLPSDTKLQPGMTSWTIQWHLSMSLSLSWDRSTRQTQANNFLASMTKCHYAPLSRKWPCLIFNISIIYFFYRGTSSDLCLNNWNYLRGAIILIYLSRSYVE